VFRLGVLLLLLLDNALGKCYLRIFVEVEFRPLSFFETQWDPGDNLLGLFFANLLGL
jgi:hypothetical protein